MLKKCVMILMLLMTVSSEALAQDQQFTIVPKITEDTSWDFLEVFTEEEKCVILAIEPQLDIFAMFYSFHHAGLIATASDISLFDVASLYWNSEVKTLDGFLDYIIAPMSDRRINIDINITAFKKKVHQDHLFIIEIEKQKTKRKEEQRKLELEEKKRVDFLEFLYKIYEEIADSPQGRSYLRRIKEELTK